MSGTVGTNVDQHTVLIISDNKTDHLILSSCLERAIPKRFRLATPDSIDRPLEALMQPEIDAVILSYGPNTEYMLRLAQRHNPAIPMIVLLDEAEDLVVSQLRDYGAQDYLIRGQLQDALAHRILDYSIQLKSARQTIQQLSNQDPLTGALNRAGFRAHLNRAIDRSKRYGFQTALLCINIDQFAHINDQYGEAGGDLVIKTVAQRLRNKMRGTDSIARLGGDEFAIVLEDIGSSADVESMAQTMLFSLSGPMTLAGQQLSIHASIGSAIYPDGSTEPAEMVDCARSAMQQAKSVQGNKYIRYTEQLVFDERGASSLAGELRTAIRKNQFELHYQPRIDLATEQLVGLEALLRWNHPERGLLTPAEFLGECEDMGLMKTIGYQVIQHAASALVWLEGEGLATVDVAVNLSFSQLQDERFVEVVRDIIRNSGANANRLEFELTETTILKNPAPIKAQMDELRLLGISFSLDDFGTGFSQLSHLTELPISALKIDTAFVRDVPGSEQQAAVCTMIIEMAHRLGILVIAEGAERYEQVEFLREQRCHQVQGFYYSAAIPLQQLPRFIEEQRFRQHRHMVS